MKSGPDGSFIWTIILGLFVLLLTVVAHGFPDSLKFAPYLAGYGTLAMVVVLIAGRYYPEILRWTETTLQDLWGGGDSETVPGDDAGAEQAPSWAAVIRSMSYAVGFLALVILFGLVVITPLFIVTYLVVEARVKLVWAVLAAAVASGLLVFGMILLQVEIWAGIVPEIIPEFVGGSIFPPI